MHLLRLCDVRKQVSIYPEHQLQITIATLQRCASAVAGLDGSSRGVRDTAVEPWLWERSSDGLRTYAALAAVLALGSVPAMRSQQLADLPYFISLAVITIYVGATICVPMTHRRTACLRLVRSRCDLR